MGERVSEDNHRDAPDQSAEKVPAVPEYQGEELYDDADDIEERGPLTSDEFRAALRTLDDIGVTWTADRVPHAVAKKPETKDALFSKEVEDIRRSYPDLPRELGLVVFHALTGTPVPLSLVGGKDELDKKVAVVNEVLITGEYRSEFFFKYAIKVPYFLNVDWEVVVKAFEKNVKGVPGIPYALLALHFRDPDTPERGIEHRTTTVAVDERLVDTLIGSLQEVKTALEQARVFADAVSKQSGSKGEDDD